MKRFVKRLVAAVLALVVAAGVSVGISATKAEAATLPTPFLGVDVSSFQGDIDWTQVAASGVTFAMIRVGNTRYGIDEKFAQNVVGATQAGIRTGVYVYTYATTAQEAAADAQLAVAAMAAFPVTFPVAIDLEDSSQKKLPASTQAAIVDTFCEIVENAGYVPMVYSNMNWFNNSLAPVTWDHWVAQYNSTITYTNPFSMWQSSSSGSIPGINGKVDLDYVYEDYFNEILPEGQVTVDGLTFNYSNWKRTNGFRTENGVTYFYDVDGSRVTDRTVTSDEGTIIRICKDGHVVKVSAEMQQYAVRTQQNFQNAVNALTAAQASLTGAQAAYDSALAYYQPLEAQAQVLAEQATEAATAYQADPTNVDLANAAVTAATEYQTVLAQAQTALASFESAQTDLTNVQNDIATKTQAVQTAQNEAAIAAAAVVIPD